MTPRSPSVAIRSSTRERSRSWKSGVSDLLSPWPPTAARLSRASRVCSALSHLAAEFAALDSPQLRCAAQAHCSPRTLSWPPAVPPYQTLTSLCTHQHMHQRTNLHPPLHRALLLLPHLVSQRRWFLTLFMQLSPALLRKFRHLSRATLKLRRRQKANPRPLLTLTK